MRNLFLLISKFGAMILFVFLQGISLFLVVNYNDKQKEIFLYSSNLFTSKIVHQVDVLEDYVDLRNQNDSILLRNAQLLGRIFTEENMFQPDIQDMDSSLYRLIPARIANKTVHLRNNRLTVDKGQRDGVQENMGVITEKGVVGVVHQVNSQFASVMPVINTRFQLSARVKHKNYVGDAIWEPYDERYIQLNHIPKHAQIANGDTILTSGYSTIFPPGIQVGIIENIQLPAGSNYFKVKVRMNIDFSRLDYVYLIDYKWTDLKNQMDQVN